MHPFHDYLCQQLDEKLKKHAVVVVYDERREFEVFFDRELAEVGKGYGDLPRVFIGERLTFLARYAGSFLALRAAVEGIAEKDQPEPLIVYVPGVTRDRVGSVLMELEKGGVCYEPQLRRLALNVLRKRFTDGQIDEMLKPASVGYAEVVSFLRQGDEGRPASVLRTIFDGMQSEALLARWIGGEDRDGAIAERDARAELLKLIETRLGLVLPDGASVAEAREKTVRYLLVCEFRSDLACDPPASVGMVPVAPGADAVERIREVAEILRRGYAAPYVALADRVESDLGLGEAKIDAAHLGNIDTFRFEEKALLARAGELIAGKKYAEALGIVSGRKRSFWVDRDVGRQAQWEACRLMAELGREVERVRAGLGKVTSDPARWVAAYASEDGWHEADALQRRLEAWVARMDDEPAAERALAVVRREHEELLKRMAEDFSRVLAKSAWTVPGVLHQTHVYPEVVQQMGGRVAYFFVDAMRFEMGVELGRQLAAAKDLTIRPAIAALPSITPVGMAALLPGAAASFSVVEHKGKLAARIEGSVMPGLAERLKFLKAKVPDSLELTLDKVLTLTSGKLAKALGSASLVVVRSQEIDAIGELDVGLIARQVMDSVIGNLARAIKKLAAAGIENFVVSADHGHQFAIRKDDDMKTDNPGGNCIDLHRRCWIGHGGTTPPGTVRVTGAELGYDTNLDFVFPTGLGVFKAGGGLSFHHGSISLQELVVPVVSLRMPRPADAPPAGKLVQLRGVPDRLTNRTFGVTVRVVADLFTVEPAALRIILMAGGEQVGEAGMAVGGELDRASHVLRVKPGAEANVGMMLTRDDCATVRIVVLDAATDAVLDHSDDLPVKLGI